MNFSANKSLLLLVLILILFTGCNKNNPSIEVVSTDNDVTELTNKAIASLDKQEVFSDNPEMGIYMLDDGIAPCFLVDGSDLIGDDAIRPNIRRHALIACLRSLALSESQVPLVREYLSNYNSCNEQAISRAREIYNELQAAYRTKYQRVSNAYQTGTITASEFRTKVAELRVAFKRDLRSLHLREKIDEAFGRCFRLFISNLHSVLSDRQWNAFRECFLGSE